eukprot:gene44532-55404_t
MNLDILQSAQKIRKVRRESLTQEYHDVSHKAVIQPMIKSMDLKLAEFRAVDEDLRLKLDNMVKILKPLQPVATQSKVLYDVSSSNKLLARWAATLEGDSLFKANIIQAASGLDYGHKLLKPHKLIPRTFLKKMFVTSKPDASTLPVVDTHPVF